LLALCRKQIVTISIKSIQSSIKDKSRDFDIDLTTIYQFSSIFVVFSNMANFEILSHVGQNEFIMSLSMYDVSDTSWLFGYAHAAKLRV